MSTVVPEPFNDPQGQLGLRRHMQGPLTKPELEKHATRGDLLEAHLLLGELVQLMRELVEVDSGEVIAVHKRYVINANRPFETFLVEAPDQFHSVKIDNPAAVDVDVIFAGNQPSAGNSDERVPPRTGRVLTAPYDEVSIGIDPAVMPAGNTYLYVTFYSRPYQPTTYAFAP